MNKVWKWILGIGGVLLALAAVAGIFRLGMFLGYARISGLSGRMDRVSMMDGHRFIGSGFDHLSDMHFIGFGLGWLLWLVVIGLAAWGAYSLFANRRRAAAGNSGISSTAPAMVESASPTQACPNCGKPTAADWNTCPYCGQPIGDSDPQI